MYELVSKDPSNIFIYNMYNLTNFFLEDVIRNQ